MQEVVMAKNSTKNQANDAEKKTKKAVINIKGIRSLDDLKAECLRVFKKDGDLKQKDVIEALDNFDVEDADIEAFYDWLNLENIKLSWSR